LYHWAHTGGILLVNEFAEIRGDVQTVFHGALDKRRIINIPDLELMVGVPDHAMFVATYNPGYQSKSSPLKFSTLQRLPAMRFGYPDAKTETELIVGATNIQDVEVAEKLAVAAETIRQKEAEDAIVGGRDGVSTRLLIYAAEAIRDGMSVEQACEMNVVVPLSADAKEEEKVRALIRLTGLY
jgi:nitric oxide reductase NorQ protein